MTRTFKPRRGRITRRQAAALISLRDPLIDADEPWEAIAGQFDEVVLEIGFGTGAATAALAVRAPDQLIIACDVHTPGVGDLLARIDDEGLGNVRVLEGDALDLLRTRVPDGSLTGVRSFFPDPWPKARHHKRRLVQSAHVALIGSKLRAGGWWHLATDATDYVEQMIEVLAADGWAGGVIERPAWRPVTRYEQFAINDGRPVLDLQFAPETGPNDRNRQPVAPDSVISPR